jgi:Tol biopolymer transport system component
VSVASDGTQGNRSSHGAHLSVDGRFVAFHSEASNLVPGDTNQETDLFVRDLETGATTRVSVASDGTEADDWSYHPTLSDDGRFVAFQSIATNLVPGDTNDAWDTFVHDRVTGQTSRVSLGSNEAQGDSDSWGDDISGNGRYVLFHSRATNFVLSVKVDGINVYLRDLQLGNTELISRGPPGAAADGQSWGCAVNADGRYVVFLTEASNIAPDDENDRSDIVWRDRETGETRLVSVASDGTQANTNAWVADISPDGRFVVFVHAASNLVPGDTNGENDVFVHDTGTGETECVSVSSHGELGNRESMGTAMSQDGRFVAFESLSDNLVPGDTNGSYDEEQDLYYGRDVFVHDRKTKRTRRVSVSASGVEGDGESFYPSLSSNGRWVSFDSTAPNLVSDDDNGWGDVFVYRYRPWVSVFRGFPGPLSSSRPFSRW